MSDHSELGASGSHRWMNCAGQINLSRGLERKGSVYADGGTAAHEILSRCLVNDVAPDLFLDTVLQTSEMDQPITVDDEMIEAVGVALEYVAAQLEAGAKLLGVEVKFDLSPLNPPGPMYGRADIVLQHPGTPPRRFQQDGKLMVVMPKPGLLEVIDFKYGVGVVVEVLENPQLMYYALGAVVATNEIPAKLKSTVIQPRAPHPDGIVRSYEYDYPELKAFKGALFGAAVATQDPDAPLTVGPWCQFCPALAVCPAQLERAQAVAEAEFDQVAVDIVADQDTNLPVPEALSLQRLQEVMVAAPVFESWLKAVASHLRDLTEAGEDTGYKLVPKRGRRMWRDEEQAERAANMQGLGDLAYARKLKSVTQMELALKKAGRAAMDKDLWSMVSSGTNLVPNSDPRPALPPSNLPPEADFEVVDLPGPELDSTLDHSVGYKVALAAASGDEEEVDGVIVVDVPIMDTEVTTEKYTIRAEDAVTLLDVPLTEEESNAPEIVPEMWMVEDGDNMFFVQASDEAEAREEARVHLGVTRLPNHTRLTPS